MVTRRGKRWALRIRPFREKEIGVMLPVKSKQEAKAIEVAVMTACRSGDYRYLDPVSREVCIRMFRNQKWQLPADLTEQTTITQELTLWKAMELCIKYPDVHDSPNRERMEQAFLHIIEQMGDNTPVRSIWIPQIKEYLITRLAEGAAPSTINKEKAALSKMFQVLMELRYLEANPARMVKGLNESAGEREVYVSFADFNAVLGFLPRWIRPIMQTLYFTGMRRGEALGLTWDNVNLDKRIISLHAGQTKERRKKRVPIHRVLVPILKGIRDSSVRSMTGHLFLTSLGKPPAQDSLRNPWVAAVAAVGLDPKPRIHDLRHVWSTNAMRSGMDFEIREAILGHVLKKKTISQRYVSFSDEDLVRAINGMTFDHGGTEILISNGGRKG